MKTKIIQDPNCTKREEELGGIRSLSATMVQGWTASKITY